MLRLFSVAVSVHESIIDIWLLVLAKICLQGFERFILKISTWVFEVSVRTSNAGVKL